jgi:hypothetical protein
MPATEPVPSATETIGRFPHLLAHVASQLPGLAEGENTFEQIRSRYARTMTALATRGLARVTAPRAGVGAAHRYWTSVRDLIKELQTLGWIQAGIPGPSVKSTVDSHRHRCYPLTEEGLRVGAVATDRRALADELTTAALAAHPYLRGLLLALDDGPLFCPEVPQKDVGEAHGTAYWAKYAVNLLERSDPLIASDLEKLENHLKVALRRRFGSRRDQGLEITSKELTEATNDALADFALSARGLRFGATTLDALKSWGMELRLLDQSRYVPGHEGGNLIWLCCDLDSGDDGLRARRRTFSGYGEPVARAMINSYFELRARRPADRSEDEPGSGRNRGRRDYQPIHVVRAAAAVETGTAREVGDRALEALAAGELNQGVRVRLLAPRFEVPPRSEPMYSRGGTRALTLTMTRAEDREAGGVDENNNEVLKEDS